MSKHPAVFCQAMEKIIFKEKFLGNSDHVLEKVSDFVETFTPALKNLPASMGGMPPLELEKVQAGGIFPKFRALAKALNQLLFRDIGPDVQIDTSSVVIGEVNFLATFGFYIYQFQFVFQCMIKHQCM